mgnify:CR=1 FL=1
MDEDAGEDEDEEDEYDKKEEDKDEEEEEGGGVEQDKKNKQDGKDDVGGDGGRGGRGVLSRACATGRGRTRARPWRVLRGGQGQRPSAACAWREGARCRAVGVVVEGGEEGKWGVQGEEKAVEEGEANAAREAMVVLDWVCPRPPLVAGWPRPTRAAPQVAGALVALSTSFTTAPLRCVFVCLCVVVLM